MRKVMLMAAVFSITAGVLGAEPVSPVRKAMQGFVDRNVISGGGDTGCQQGQVAATGDRGVLGLGQARGDAGG